MNTKETRWEVPPKKKKKIHMVRNFACNDTSENGLEP